MQPDEIQLSDLWRIAFGQVPWPFLIEVVLRTAFLFTVLLSSMRLLGKRMAGQLNKNEMIAMSTLAAAVGVPILAPDRGVLPALIIAIVVVLIGRSVARWAYSSQRFESMSQDKITTLVVDSVLQLPALARVSITRERLFAHLRSKGFTHLGQVKRVYFEAGGFFTFVRNEPPRPGLKLIPDWDTDFIGEQDIAADVEVCRQCGCTRDGRTCTNCQDGRWEKAVTGSG